MTRSPLESALRLMGRVLPTIAGLLLLLVAGCAGLFWLSFGCHPQPIYSLIVYNQGDLEIVGGYLSGDSLWRPVGQVLPGWATEFVFEGCSGRDDADYRLHLVRSDSSRVTVRVGWITGDWDASSLSHDISVVPSDTATTCGRVLPMYKQNELRHLLHAKHLLDYPQSGAHP